MNSLKKEDPDYIKIKQKLKEKKKAERKLMFEVVAPSLAIVLGICVILIITFKMGLFGVLKTGLNTGRTSETASETVSDSAIKKIIGIILLIISIPHGVMVMAYSLLISSFASQLINSWPNRKLLNYHYSEQIKDILPAILLSLFMSAVVWCCGFLPFGTVVILLLQISVGIFIYIAGSVIFRIDSFGYMISAIKQILKKKDLS